MKTLGIIGAGHLGQQIAHYAINDGHYKNVVFFDDYCDTSEVNGFKIIGDTKSLYENFKNKLFDEYLVGIGYRHMKFRESIFNLYKNKIPVGEIIHSSCYMDQTIMIGMGNIILPNCTFDFKVNLGDNIFFNIGCSIAHDSIIKSHTFLSPRVAIAGFAQIGKRCIIGINTTIINNIIIKNDIQTGAGTIVINDLLKKGLFVGNPSRFIK